MTENLLPPQPRPEKRKLVCIKIYLILRIYVFFFSVFLFFVTIFSFFSSFPLDEVFMEPLLHNSNWTIPPERTECERPSESYERKIDKFPSAKLTITPRNECCTRIASTRFVAYLLCLNCLYHNLQRKGEDNNWIEQGRAIIFYRGKMLCFEGCGLT